MTRIRNGRNSSSCRNWRYQIVVNPVVLGKGRTMFDGVKEKLNLKLTKTRVFGNGNVFHDHTTT